ncbi:MAG: hypothetical protein U0892_09960 [Pirellulales bacterium]
MSQFLFYYVRPDPATWLYLSVFLLVGVFFVFHRVWSVRNLDILLLVLLAPGLLLVYEGRKLRSLEIEPISSKQPLAIAKSSRMVSETNPIRTPSIFVSVQQDAARSGDVPRDEAGKTAVANPPAANATGVVAGAAPPAAPVPLPSASNVQTNQTGWTSKQIEFVGFAWLLVACGLLMIRMLIDPALVRRPLLEPNLSIGGLSFIGISLFIFLMSNVMMSDPGEAQRQGPRLGPGYALLNKLPDLPTTPEHEADEWNQSAKAAENLWLHNLARLLAVLSNLAIVLGIIGIGYWHFDNVKTGIGCATMYLLFPYTAQMTGNVEHGLPAALLTLAVLSYRQPLLAGCFLGLASGLVYYPLFLLPLWISFYFQRGLWRLLAGVMLMLVLLAGLLLLGGVPDFLRDIRDMFGLWKPAMQNLSGIWGLGFEPMFRLPVLVAFVILTHSFIFWPMRKTLGTLMCGTAAVMLAAQFWHGYGGGLYMAWFLPCVILTIFRPNLDDRIATRVVRPRWSRPERISVSAASTPQTTAA